MRTRLVEKPCMHRCSTSLLSGVDWKWTMAPRRICRPNRESSRRRNLVRIDLEADECVRTERAADGGIGRIATARNQYPPDARDIIAGIEGVPSASQIRLEPAGKVHRSIGRRDADVGQIAGTIARRNVHTAAECD